MLELRRTGCTEMITMITTANQIRISPNKLILFENEIELLNPCFETVNIET